MCTEKGHRQHTSACQARNGDIQDGESLWVPAPDGWFPRDLAASKSSEFCPNEPVGWLSPSTMAEQAGWVKEEWVVRNCLLLGLTCLCWPNLSPDKICCLPRAWVHNTTKKLLLRPAACPSNYYTQLLFFYMSTTGTAREERPGASRHDNIAQVTTAKA